MERQGRIAELISLLDYAISTGNDDLAQEVRSDIFKETKGTLQMNHGGIANIEDMTLPIGMAHGGYFDKYLGPSEKGGTFMSATKDSMREHPFQTSLFLEMGFDKLFDLISAIPMMKEGGSVGMAAGGLHPLVVFREMHDAYTLDGGTMDFKEYFEMIQKELDLMSEDN